MEYFINKEENLTDSFIKMLNRDDLVIVDSSITYSGLFKIKLNFIMQICKVKIDDYLFYYTQNDLVYIQNIESKDTKICRFELLPDETFANKIVGFDNYLLPIGSIVSCDKKIKYIITGRIGSLEIKEKQFYTDYIVEEYPSGYKSVTSASYLNSEDITTVLFLGLQDDEQDDTQLQIKNWLEHTEIEKYTKL